MPPQPPSTPSDPGDFSPRQLRRRAGHWLKLMGMDGQGGRLLLAVAAAAWLASGIYRVQPDEQGVVVRLGKWSDTTAPGLHYHLPWPVDSVLLPKVTQIKQLRLGNLYDGAPTNTPDPREKQMLTGDENIVEADAAVFWRIKDAGQFLFRVNKPEESLRIAAEGALRDVISHTPI